MRRVISVMFVVLVINIALGASKAMAQLPKYPKMAPVNEYLMERDAEIRLARSAAPDSISRDATVIVLGRLGYETAVRGKNGFVCLVERSWMAPFDSPEYWNPKVRGANCLNPQAARSMGPIIDLRTRMVMAGRSTTEILAALKAEFANKRLPDLQAGAFAFMMSKSAYLFDTGDHNGSHVMVFTSLKDGKDWGAGVSGSPVFAGPYWFLTPNVLPEVKGLPTILVFAVEVPKWSDGTSATMDQE